MEKEITVDEVMLWLDEQILLRNLINKTSKLGIGYWTTGLVMDSMGISPNAFKVLVDVEGLEYRKYDIDGGYSLRTDYKGYEIFTGVSFDMFNKIFGKGGNEQ